MQTHSDPHLAQLLLLLRLGPERMLQMHRSHVGLLCYPRTIQVFLDVPTFTISLSPLSV